ncbi:hypothetical protein XBP1_650065 [Xenorhabdus bovienii str. puntauvense]|uniref:Uncharacterized protein n=3 Tax=Xenorhabdus bovienii TaxID=40576 RepID=A0A077Q5B3_XENBV|nr:hypothetical protein XBP1_650065 [Xenorhabdus bovienii str. puntauvense]CDH25780.1 hypothetical protein XBKB1_4190050 [Xenorhabdus bovienii str. kraussei Becker Underwood]CDH31292.1 hypothetical protein XBI1_1420040 [Xenorhabdus bovienii str. Intermedium]
MYSDADYVVMGQDFISLLKGNTVFRNKKLNESLRSEIN